jgi:uncharacterized membrane protein YcaP (DUF421 family)
MLPYILISDGKLNETNLKKSGFEYSQIKNVIKSKGGKDVSDVFCMTYFRREFFVQLKRDRRKK